MAKNLKNVNLNGLSAMQKKQMQKHKMLLQVMLGFLFLIGLKATKKVLND